MSSDEVGTACQTRARASASRRTSVLTAMSGLDFAAHPAVRMSRQTVRLTRLTASPRVR